MALLDMAPGALVRSKARWRYVFQSAVARVSASIVPQGAVAP
jgi:hypothetical protein